MKKLFKAMSALMLTAAMVTGMCMTSFATSEAKGNWNNVGADSTANLTVGVSSPDDVSANGGDTLLAYQVVDIKYDEASNNLTYEFTAAFKGFQAQNDTYSNLDPKAYGELKEEDLKPLLGAFTAYIKGQEPKPTATYNAVADDKGVANFGPVAMGQYIIVGDGTSNGAKIYQTVTAEVAPEIQQIENKDVYMINDAYTVAMKTSKPSISKNITEGTVTDEKIITTGKQEGDKHEKHQQTSEIGKEITYELNVAVPTYPEGATNKTFFAGDTLSAGLDLKADSIIVTGYVKGSETGTVLEKDKGAYTTTVKANNETIDNEDEKIEKKISTSLFVDFNFDDIAMFDHVVIQYKATLNENAVLGTTAGNPNDVDLIYSNSPFDGTTFKPTNPDEERPGPDKPGYGKDEDKEIVYTYALVVDKFEEKHEGEKLSGAEFELYREYKDGVYSDPVVDKDGKTVTLVTDENGAAMYMGLQKGTYYLKETVAPTGYNPMDTAIVVNIDNTTIPYYTETSKAVTHYTYTIKAEEALNGNKVQATINGDLVWMDTVGNVITTAPTAGKPEGYEVAYVKAVKATVENVIEINRDAQGANGFYKAGVANNKGAQLPSTGGMGTTIFTVVGICLMLGAAIVMVTRRRMAGRE